MRWNGPEPEPHQFATGFQVLLAIRFILAICLTVVFMVPILLARILGIYRLQLLLAQLGSQLMLAVLGLKLVRNDRAAGASGYVANHSSWLDIFVLFAAAPAQFVAKREVSKWPGIGFLGQLFGTVFIERTRSKAGEHIDVLVKRLEKGENLLFFPEGTSTDGLRILPYRSTLFGAFFDAKLIDQTTVQSVYVQYAPNAQYDPRIYGLWGGMKFGKRIMVVLSLTKRGTVHVSYGPVRQVKDFQDRKTLAAALEADARALADPQIASRSA